MGKHQAIILLLLVLYLVPVPIGAQDQCLVCHKAVFVYLDISGSMFVDGKKFHGIVPYGTKVEDRKHLLDAMVKFIGKTFSQAGVLSNGDRFEFYGFAASTVPLIEPIRNYKYADDSGRLESLYDTLDTNRDGWIKKDDLEANPGIHKEDLLTTNFGKLIDNVQSKVGNFLSAPDCPKKYTATVLIFTDADYDSASELPPLRNSVKRLLDNMELFITTGKLRIILCPFKDTNVARLFQEFPQINTQEFYVKENEDIQELAGHLRQTLLESLNGSINFSEDNIDYLEDASRIRFSLPLKSSSCFENQVKEITYRITSVGSANDSAIYTRTVAINKSIPAFGRETADVIVDFRKFGNGKFRVEFELAQESGRIDRKSTEVEIKSSVAPIFVIFGILMAGLIAAVVGSVLLRRPKRQVSSQY